METPGENRTDERQTLLNEVIGNETRYATATQGDYHLIVDKSNNHTATNYEDNSEVKTDDKALPATSTRTLITLESSTTDTYDPFQHRDVKNPTNNVEALIHMLKGSLGSGILVMPLAFQNGGLWFSLFATITVGLIVTYCTHIFVKCGHILCKRKRIPSVNFREIGELSFLEGPQCLQKYSKLAGLIVDVALVTETLGCCCAYIILVSRNFQQVIEYYSGVQWDLRLYMAALLIPLICLSFLKDLKRLAPISMISNMLFIFGILVSYYYIFTDLPSTSERPAFTSWTNLPTFFGTTIFALEGIGTVVPIENNMKHPQYFLGCPGVLNMGMFTVITLYTITGFFGYLKYGPDTKANITVNLPVERLLGQALKISIAIAVLFTYSLLFYVAMSIVYGRETKKNEETSPLIFHTKRIAVIVSTVVIAASFPNLGPFLTLIGALCLSTVGLILPPIFEVLIYSKSPGFGVGYWRLWKNAAIFLFGIIGLLSGTMVGIKEMIDTFDIIKD